MESALPLHYSYSNSSDMYLPYQAISSNDLKPNELTATSNASFHDQFIRRIGSEQRCGAKNFFSFLCCSKCDGVAFGRRELGLGGFLFSMSFRWLDKDPLFCLAAQAALPLALRFLSFFSTSFFCRVG